MTIYLATLAGWLNRKQHDVIMYLNADNEILKYSGVEVIQTRVGCPQQNGYAESFVLTIKRERLDHMIFFT